MCDNIKNKSINIKNKIIELLKKRIDNELDVDNWDQVLAEYNSIALLN